MSGRPASQGPESAPSPDTKQAVPATDKRSWKKRALTPVVLGGVGLALFLFALVLYPSVSQLPAPSYSLVEVDTKFPIQGILYQVTQVSSDVAEVQITVELTKQLPRGAASPAVSLSIALPPYTAFRNCPHPACGVGKGLYTGYYWTRSLSFGSSTIVTSDFFVKAHSFGVIFNDINASASIPEVEYQGTGATGTLLFDAEYRIPSASSYDWSSYPALLATTSEAAWGETVNHGDTATREAVGIDHGHQVSDENKTFFAGALLGLAGGAVLSAIVEALHAHDLSGLNHEYVRVGVDNDLDYSRAAFLG